MTSPQRSKWTGDETVEIVATPAVTKAHADYGAAKTGDPHAAARLVVDIMNTKWINEHRTRITAASPIIVGVHAVEGLSVNMIGSAMDEWLALQTGLPMDRNIIQTNKVGHTGSSGWTRLANQALFEGAVVHGANYWLLDDFVGQGGTLANLRGHIISNGGIVVGYTTLTGRADSAILGLTDKTLNALREKHGRRLEEWWHKRFGFDVSSLTHSEARYLIRAENADTIRNKIIEAKQD